MIAILINWQIQHGSLLAPFTFGITMRNIDNPLGI
jgi:hypothetical protein